MPIESIAPTLSALTTQNKFTSQKNQTIQQSKQQSRLSKTQIPLQIENSTLSSSFRVKQKKPPQKVTVAKMPKISAAEREKQNQTAAEK